MEHKDENMTIGKLCAVLAVTLMATFAFGEEGSLRLATTTSTENSGLLDRLLPVFEERCKCRVLVIPVGSGRALKMGEFGDIDVLMVHSPADEKAFVEAGFGTGRRPVMYNDFVLLGPPNDPAGIAGLGKVVEGFGRIAAVRAPFVSRGDNSGTHRKEQSLWEQVEKRKGEPVKPEPEWYLSAGISMGQAILLADEKGAYTLADRGTFLFFRDKTDMKIIIENEPRLHNPYSVILVNPEIHPHVEIGLAQELSDWLVSDEAQDLIASYRVQGEQLFFPNAR